MRLARFTKSPAERKRYRIDYSEWLDSGEQVQNVTFGVTPSDGAALEVDANSIDAGGRAVTFFANFGENLTNYTVGVQIQTTGGQIKDDSILFLVRD